MKTKLKRFQARVLCAVTLGMGSSFSLVPQCGTAASAHAAPAKTFIPWSQIGAKAGAEYQGDGLAVTPTESGARLRCVFQRLEGEVTSEGLWLTSTVIPPSGTVNDRFQVKAVAVGRAVNFGSAAADPAEREATPLFRDERMGEAAWASESGVALCFPAQSKALPRTGTVSVAGQTVRFTRPGLVEEYSVSLDGVRQDFVLGERPEDSGELRVELDVSGTQVEPLADGAQLVLGSSGRKIAYSRLRVTDATGKELPAQLVLGTDFDVAASRQSAAAVEKEDGDGLPTRRYAGLAVVVDDADAVYPVRIDPTFSDANWISMGGIAGANSEVFASVVDGSGNLYIGGTFTVVGDVIANRVAKWNGSRWKALGLGMNNTVYALAVSGSNVYAGGDFTTAGGSAANRIARWDGSSWSAMGLGMNSFVWALAASGSDVYAGGGFTTAGGNAANRVAKWDGSSWSALGLGMNDRVSALAVSGSEVYAGGYFTTADGNAADCVAKWNGNSWSALGLGMNFNVRALVVAGSDVYAGGDFTTAGGGAANYIAKWNGSSWSTLGSGMNSNVLALAVLGGDLYAGGRFTTAGGSVANYIAKWDGTSWSAVGSGMNKSVLTLVVSGSDLYVGGDFTAAGGSGANYIAKWNGSDWSALGSGMGGVVLSYVPVSALAVSCSGVYAGGTFTTAGDSTANSIAIWDGSSWSALGSGMNSGVYTLAVSGSNVYAGGYFTMATNSGGVAVTVNRIARWDGSSWSPLGLGMGGGGAGVEALAVSGSNLYAGGGFTTAGGSAANRVAKWDGSSWSVLGSGMNNTVLALAVSGSNLYAGGRFTSAGGNPASYIAKWDGTGWLALGSGMGGGGDILPYVYALAVSGSDLYAGGWFTTAGGKVSGYVARAYLPTLPVLSVLPSGIQQDGIKVSWPLADTADFTLEQAGTLAAPASWVTNTASVTDDGTNKLVTLPATNSAQFFRLRRQ